LKRVWREGLYQKKKLDFPITLDKNTLCTNIPSNITAKLEKVWRKVLYQKKLYLPMTINLGMSEQHGPKKTGIPKHEVSNEEVDKTQRPSSPPSGKEDIKEVTPYSSLPDVVVEVYLQMMPYVPIYLLKNITAKLERVSR
jgi:hypothetical protein